MFRSLLLCAVLLLTGTYGEEVSLISLKDLKAQREALGEHESIFVGFSVLGSFVHLEPLLLSVMRYIALPDNAKLAKISVFASDLDETEAFLGSHNIQAAPSYTLVLFTKTGVDAFGPEYYEDDGSVDTEVVQRWVLSHATLRTPKMGNVLTADDSEFGTKVYMPSKNCFVLYDKDEVSPLAHSFAKASESFTETGKDTVFFVRATPSLAPERYIQSLKDVEHPEAPFIVFFGRRKGKYNPVVLKVAVDASAEEVEGVLNAKLKPVEITKLRETPVINLTEETFTPFVKSVSKGVLVMFHAPWCGHCKRLMPDFDQLANDVFSEKEIAVAKVDAVSYPGLAATHKVDGYPTLIFFDKTLKRTEYSGSRSLEDLKKFVYSKLGRAIPGEEESAALILNPENFAAVTTSGKAVFVKFFAPWCGHCKRMAPDWEKLALSLKENDKVVIAKLDGSRYSDLTKNLPISGYPTLLMFSPSEDEPKVYSGARNNRAWTKFITAHLPKEADKEAAKRAARKQQKVVANEETQASVAVTAGELTELDGDKLALLKVKPTKGVLLMFYASWCGHCKKLAPDYKKLATHFKDRFDEYVFFVFFFWGCFFFLRSVF